MMILSLSHCYKVKACPKAPICVSPQFLLINIKYNVYPGSPKAINSMVFPKRPFFLVGIYNQQFQGTIILMVFDFQGYNTTYIYNFKFLTIPPSTAEMIETPPRLTHQTGKTPALKISDRWLESFSTWWFQPMWKNTRQNWNLHQIGMKEKNM